MEKDMTILASLELKTIVRETKANPIETRRAKLSDKLKEQVLVYEALQRGEEYKRVRSVSSFDEDGNKVTNNVEQTVKPNFFEQDGGWYVQCRYGSRIMNIYGRNNAVFVKKFSDIGNVLAQLITATEQGEFDKTMASLVINRK